MSRPELKGDFIEEIKDSYGNQLYPGGKVQVKDASGAVIKEVSLQEVRDQLDRKIKIGERLAFASDYYKAGETLPTDFGVGTIVK